MKKDVWWPQPARAVRWGASAVAAAMLLAGTGAAREFGPWGAPIHAEDLPGSSDMVTTEMVDGCPILSPYDGSLYMASNRAGGAGLLDIWIAPKSGDGWGDPVNAGSPINTGAEEFCPTPARGNRFFFVRRLSATDTDIYVVKKLPTGWGEPEMLPKGEGQINSDAEEWSPSVYETDDGREILYFASTRNSVTGFASPAGKQDIFYSVDFGAAQLAQGGANSPDPAHSDARPNVRRDGLELVWDSTRGGGAPDIWTARRDSVDAPWGPASAITIVNSAAPESRPSLSWDGTTLLLGSGRPGGDGMTDIYVSKREKVTGRR